MTGTERPQVLGPEELVQILRAGKRGGGWRLSRKAATELVAAQYDMRRESIYASPGIRVHDRKPTSAEVESQKRWRAW